MAYEYLNALKDILDLRRRERLRHGKGHGALRRERQRAAQWHEGTRREDRDQEHEQLFSGVRRALEYEIPRQIEVVKRGGKLIQETRRWDDVAGITEDDAHARNRRMITAIFPSRT